MADTSASHQQQKHPGHAPLLGSVTFAMEVANAGAGVIARRFRAPFSRFQQHHAHPVAPYLESLHRVQADSLQEALETGSSSQRLAVRPRLQKLRGVRVSSCINPKGPGCNDNCMRERVINILTSLPFIFVGAHTMRQRRSPEGRQFGASLVSVGVAATLYHATSGRVRSAMRKLDYWTISLSTAAMARALHPSAPKGGKALSLATMALVPFQPLAVTGTQVAVMEVEFARQAWQDPTLRGAYGKHVLAGALGMACFGLENNAIAMNIDCVHSLWHCLACYAVASPNALMARKEAQQEALLQPVLA